jgi:hypothetical protein
MSCWERVKIKVGKMTYDVLGPGALDYLPCRYGTSRLLFRGPKRNLNSSYCAFIGGTETYGKFIQQPFPALVELELGMPCVNFGQANAGIDAFSYDPFVIDAAAKANVTVVQVMGAQNMTNRFYAVHPRRNDRFISTSTLLRKIYRDVDFADFHYNKHMLTRLMMVCPDRFEVVRQELQQAWLARMRLMLKQISGKSILLWFAEHTPDAGSDEGVGLGPDPLFITTDMLHEIAGFATEVVEVVASTKAKSQGTEGQFFGEMEAVVASEMMGPMAHQEAAVAVLRAINKIT